MTETLVRDTKQDGHWFVYVDGFLIGELISNLDDSGWPTSYSYVIGLTQVSEDYENLADAERALILAYKQRLSHR